MDELSELLGESAAIGNVRNDLRRLLSLARDGRRLPAILILGDTGTGKGLVAKLLHRHGPRAGGPFVDLNCAAIPETMLEAELFGYERGAFTDARHAKPGLFQVSNGGVLFLDEVGVLPESLQAKLLTVIEERAVRRLGRTTKEPFDSWLISATNADLVSAVRARRFREDLYHRIAVLTVRLPPLRERAGDAVILAQSFLERACRDYGIPPKSFTAAARDRIAREPWPGNVRELANIVERLALLTDGREIAADDFDHAHGGSAPAASAGAPVGEREQLLAALESTGWNIVRTAAALGVARNTVRARMDRFHLRPRRPPAPSQATSAAPPSAPASSPIPVPPAGASVRWDRRHVTLLRVAFGSADATAADASHLASVAADKVSGFGGRIERLGSAVLDASFGVVPLENAARRAVSAALAIQRAVVDAARPGPEVRTVLETEQTTVGHVAGSLIIEETQRTALSAALDRLLARVTPGEVYVTAKTALFLERHFELRTVEVPPESGEPLSTVVRPDPTRPRPWRRATAFVGRETEMSLLRSRADLAMEGRGQLVGLVGDAGTGKSRLLGEFVRTLDAERTVVLPVGISALDDPTRTRPLAAALRVLFGIDPDEDATAIRDRIATRLSDLGLEPALLVPLVAFLDLAVDDALWTILDPQQRARRMRDAIRRLILRESLSRCVVFILDDLHWIDADSQVALDHLIDIIPTARVLFIAAYRPEFRHGWTGRTFYMQIPVGPLPPSAAVEFLDELIGTGADLAALKGQLLSWTEGNPFFTEEAVRTLVAVGGLTGTPGSYRVTGDIVEQTLPSTVEEVIAARIHRLPTEAGHVLQCAAVVGMEFSLGVLADVSGLADAALTPIVRELQDAELVYPVPEAREPTCRFRHALTHFVTYRSLPADRQRDLHLAVVRVMERVYGGQLDLHTETLAEHAFRGEAWEKAAAYLHAAGRRAAARSAHRAAIDYLDRAILALDRASRRRDLREQAIDVRLDLRYALMLLGRPEQTLPCLREAEAIATEIGDTHRLGRIVAFLANGLYLLGDHAEAIASARRARDIAAAVDDFPTHVTAEIYAGRALHVLGRFREATDRFRSVIDVLRGARAGESAGLPVLPSALARSYLVMALSELGEFESALATGAEAVAIADATNHPDTIQWACYALGLATLDRGEADAAIVMLERAHTICRAAELPVYVPRAAAALGHAYVLAGRADGLALVVAAAGESQATSHRNIRARILTRLAEVTVLSGKWREGIEHAGRALALAREHGERAAEAHALWALATAQSAAGQLPEAQASAEAALSLADELEMRARAARCLLDLGKLAGSMGRADLARRHLASAHAAFERLGMTRWQREARELLG